VTEAAAGPCSWGSPNAANRLGLRKVTIRAMPAVVSVGTVTAYAWCTPSGSVAVSQQLAPEPAGKAGEVLADCHGYSDPNRGRQFVVALHIQTR
jgi:hypothetical protein